MSSVLRNQDNPPTISEVSSTTKENTDNSNSKQEEKEKEKEISSTIENPTFVDDEEDNNPFSHHDKRTTKENNNSSSNNNRGDNNDDDDDDSLLLYNTSNNNKSNNVSRVNPMLKSTGEVFKTVNMNFESRVTKLLKPNTKIRIQITEAGNSNEGMSNSSKKYTVYTIKLINLEDPNNDILTRRRYSDFESLRDVLTKIFPLIVIPPIPPKNYFDFSMLNGLVGSNHENSSLSVAGSNGNSGGSGGGGASGGAGSGSGNGSIITSPKTYSYINSTHLTKGKLIEHRKRLLTNFLNNCLEIKQIRSLEFFAKFLDPNANWENGLKTDPIYSNLPNPSNKNTISFFKDNKKKLTKKTNKLLSNGSENHDIGVGGGGGSIGNGGNGVNGNGTNSQSQYIANTSMLDDINKRIMENYIGLSNDYSKLGVSSATKKSNDNELNLIFDKIGQVFDRSYITINSLIGELETKFSEPLGEIVQYTSIIHYVAKYQSKKIKQKSMLDNEIKDKRKTLEDLLKIERESNRIENAINSQVKPKNGKYNLEQQQSSTVSPAPPPGPPPSSSSSSSSSSKFKFPSFKKITQYVSEIIDQNPEVTRKQKITNLQEKIQILEKCQNIMLADLSFITDEVNKNIQSFQKRQLKMIYKILLLYNKQLIGWAKKNIDIWEEVRDEIAKM
ncbi:PX domain family protein [Candida albicans]|uniref:PX domain family protein n=1 Tax=Candida albicans TaxID=5476 RepID=A0A8H6F5K1_CANAX|nr:PX domain family protein [Candida albicans]